MEDAGLPTSPFQDFALLKAGRNKAMDKRTGLAELVSHKETERNSKSLQAAKPRLLPLQLVCFPTRLTLVLL